MLSQLMNFMTPADKEEMAKEAAAAAAISASVDIVDQQDGRQEEEEYVAKESSDSNEKKKRTRNMNKVKRSRSPHAFNLYCNDHREFLKSSNAEISFGEMGKVLAGAWRVLASDCRDKYVQIAKDLKENTAQGSTVVVSEAEKQEAQRQILIYMQNGPDPADEARRAAALEELRNRPKKKRGRVPKVRIRRVSTPFNLYCNDQRDIVKAVNPDISFGELGKLLGANWKSSDEATKAKYRALFEEKRTAADLTKAQTQTQAVGSTKVVQSEEYIASVPTPSSSSSSASVPTTITVTAAAAASVPVDDTIRMEFDEEAEDPVSLVTRAPTPAPKPAAKAAAASAAARAAPSVKKQKTTHPPVASAAAVVANTASIPTPAPAPAPAPKPTPVVKAAVAATKATKAVPAAKMIPAAKAAKAAATAAAAAAMASSSSPTTAAASAPKEVSPRVAAPKTKTPAVKNADKS